MGILLSFPCASSEVCPSLKVLDDEMEELATKIKVKKCSTDNHALFEDASPRQLAGETVRLSTRCADDWPVKTNTGDVRVPAGLKVIRYKKSGRDRIIFHLDGKIREGLVDEKAFTGEKTCPQKEEIPKAQAFYEEALFQLNLAKRIHPKANAYFDQTIDELLQKIYKSRQDPNAFSEIESKWKEQINKISSNKVERVQNFQAMIKKAYDPKSNSENKTSDTTLMVPLSVEWFNSTSELKTFFQKTWLNSGYDIRILSGGSGEGVSYYPDKSDSTNESFLQMKSLLEKTAEFIKKSAKDPDFKNSPEARWLENLPQLASSKIERMIFFSPNTWNYQSENNKWAEFIPIDQSLGGLPSDYLLSVMIHEINVNSPNFLASDTHAPEDETRKLRQCLSQYGIDELGQDSATLERFFGISSQIEAIYLKAILD